MSKVSDLEHERNVVDDETGLTGRIYGYCPVQATGEVRGSPFYFRSRWDHWTFGCSLDRHTDPVEIYFPSQGFFREGDYGSHYDASWMPYDDAERIIKECARQFVAEEGS